jgi:hypothetical protein
MMIALLMSHGTGDTQGRAPQLARLRQLNCSVFDLQSRLGATQESAVVEHLTAGTDLAPVGGEKRLMRGR